MKRREFLIQLGALSLMGMQIGMAGCVGADTKTSGDQGITSAGDATNPANTNGGNRNDQSLAGTCPKGKSCTTPNCPLWSDIDNTGICDRR